ncbi:MAG: LamG domain-containing protein [Candidatus Micrarchaeota archaeon]|nr:LamG domain-containing protein [Candidatus Micrarchaeota archaeon]
MEYLMTYGWAILAIAIVMVSLYSLGIFNLSNLAPTAIPGSCQVLRTAAQTSLAGQCGNLIPKYVARFNGQNSVISLSASSALLNPINYITIVAWVRPSTSSVGTIVAKNGPYYLGFGNPSIGASDCVGGGILTSTWHWTCGNTAIKISVWSQVAITYNGSTELVYLNGKVDNTAAQSGTMPITGDITSVGYDTPGYNQYFNGSIANIQIYNISLDNVTVKRLYQAGIGGAPIDVQHLVGWWPLNGNGNDYSGNNYQGTPTNVIWNANWQSGYTAPTT